jgi:AcrR family transcriptional regulator
MPAQSLRTRFKETVSEAILDAAEELAAEVGLQNAGLQAIAQKAGVAVGTIYNHFPDRNELFKALFKRMREHIAASLEEAMSNVEKEPFAVQLDTLVRTVFSIFDARRSMLRVALDADAAKFKQHVGKRPAQAWENLQRYAERIIQVGLKEKRLRKEHSEIMPIMLVSAVRGILIARIDEETSYAAETEAVVAFFMNGATR